MINQKKDSSIKIAFWLFILPALSLYTLFFIIPLILSIGFSFTNFDGWKKLDFIGLENYIQVFNNSDFYKTLTRTFKYALITLPFKIIIPLLLAMLVTSKYLKFTTFIRTVVYIPVLISALVVGITMNWMFGQEYGLINFIIQSFGGTPLQWALNPSLATVVISTASNWATAGFFMIMFIGGIKNIPSELYEACDIDGASGWNVFTKVTLPLLMPTTFIVLLLSTMGLLKEYALVQGVTGGGPGTSTTYMVQFMFDQGFIQYKYGYASAVGVVLSIIFIFISIVQFRLTKGGEI